MPRKSGDPASSKDRSKWGNQKLIDNLKRCIRSDYGGKSKIGITTKRINNLLGDEQVYLSPHMLNRISEIVVTLNELNVAGIQKRISHTIDEIQNRLNN